ncbi:hypothetical protein AB4Y45_35315 [Paraburkholderia sp. EG287A]|uniref:hypothetical protein n=1 Tax=Paraburkholderia sp. EG287A TaxID=3237012 RepID=UPI0034D27D55
MLQLQAIERYRKLRAEFYKNLDAHFFAAHFLQVEAGPIEDAHLWEVRAWQSRRRHLEWLELRRTYRKVPRRLELAVSVHGELCGLALGKPSHGKTRLKACYFEVKPGFDPDRKIAMVLMHAMTLWGDFLGSKEVWLARPERRHWRITEGAADHFSREKKTSTPYFKV